MRQVVAAFADSTMMPVSVLHIVLSERTLFVVTNAEDVKPELMTPHAAHDDVAYLTFSE